LAINASFSLRRLPLLPKIGWILYLAFMVTPGSDFHEIGAMMFAVAPGWGLICLFSGDLRTGLFGMSLLAGVASNASLFTRLPVWVRCLCVAAPWMTYAAYLSWGMPMGSDKGSAFAIPFFFPWAFGIGMINIAQIRKDSARRAGPKPASYDGGSHLEG
jgi:hypothetical protein